MPAPDTTLLPQTIRAQLDACSGMIFDFDGTIADSMEVWHWVDEQFLARRGLIAPPEYGHMLSTLGFDQCAVYVKELFGLADSLESIMDEWNNLAYERYATGVQFKPYARTYLEALAATAGKELAIATTLSPVLLQAALTNMQAHDLFDALVSGYEVRNDKHEPDIYLLAAQRLGIEPANCVVFEDIVPGLRSAKRAGMLAIGVRDKSGHQDIEKIIAVADGVIHSFEELLD